MRQIVKEFGDLLFRDRTDRVTRYPKWFRWIVASTVALLVANLYVSTRFLADHFALPGLLTGERLAAVTNSLAGTFIGAWLAFFFAARSRKLVRDDEEVVAGNLALFALSCMLNATLQYKEITGPYRQRPDAWLNLPPSAPLNETFDLDRKNLGFIAGEEPNVFQAIVLEEVRYELLAYSVKHHRDLILNKVWPVMAQHRLEMGAQIPKDQLRKTLGDALIRDLEVTTRALIENADENVESLPHAFKELRSALKRRHPNRKFLDFKAASD